jgi:hypothetical protein
MPQKKVGVIPYRSGQQADPFKIPVRAPITSIDLVLTGTLTVTVAITLVEWTILNLLRRVQLQINGDVKKNIGDNSYYGAGGRMLYFGNQAYYGNIPDYIAPGVGVAAHTFKAVLRIPVQMPKLLTSELEGNAELVRKSTAMQPGSGRVEVLVDWGTLSDVFSAGTATFTTAPEIEVITNSDPTLQGIPQTFDFHEHTQQLGISSGAGANADFPDDLSRIGVEPYALLLGIDNGLLDDDVYNRIKFSLNEELDVIDGSWNFYKNAYKLAAGLQATASPTGVGLALFDMDKDLGNAIQANDTINVKGWKAHVDHDALTSINRLLVHHFALVAR